MYMICDAENAIQDMASHEVTLSRGLPYLDAGGTLYSPDDLAEVEWVGRPWVGDHFDGDTHTADSPERAVRAAWEAETQSLREVLNALIDTEATLEADIGQLTLTNVQDWPQAIAHVSAASSAAEFASRWDTYEKKRTLFTLRFLRFVMTRLAGAD